MQYLVNVLKALRASHASNRRQFYLRAIHAGYFALAAIGWHDAYALVSALLCASTLHDLIDLE